MGSSWTRDQTSVPRIARWIPNHWTIREAPIISSNTLFAPFSLSSPFGTHIICMLVHLILSHMSLKLCSFFIIFIFYCLDYIISINLFLSFFFLLVQIHSWVLLVIFSFQLFYFQSPEFMYSILFYCIHFVILLTFFIWWETSLIFSFNSLCIFKIADFKSLSTSRCLTSRCPQGRFI